MKETPVLIADIATLIALANGILPSDHRDAGAAFVHAGPGLAEKMRRGPFGNVYVQGIAAANAMAQSQFGRDISELDSAQVQCVLEWLLSHNPAFFRQLRADVCGMYMSDPAVWERIGFPGPSSEFGGYPDFDKPPTTQLMKLNIPAPLASVPPPGRVLPRVTVAPGRTDRPHTA